MTLAYFAGLLITGTSTDRTGGTWTNLPAGWRFLETDTTIQYYWTGTVWSRIGAHYLPSSQKRFGAFYGGSSVGGSGLFDGGFTAAASHTVLQVLTAADGKSTRYTTATTQNSNAGFSYAQFVTMRQWNPRFKAKFKMNQTSADVRLWLGLANFVSEPSGDDQYTNPQQGIAIALRAADTVFQIIHNDGSGASVYTAVTGNPAVDTNAHTIEIIADDTNTKFMYSFDGAAFTDISTDIPAQTTSLSVQAQIETNANPGARAFELFYLELEQDK